MIEGEIVLYKYRSNRNRYTFNLYLCDHLRDSLILFMQLMPFRICCKGLYILEFDTSYYMCLKVRRAYFSQAVLRWCGFYFLRRMHSQLKTQLHSCHQMPCHKDRPFRRSNPSFLYLYLYYITFTFVGIGVYTCHF